MAFLDETGLAELWELIKAEDAKAPKIEMGSYRGTGTYGSSNPTKLTFGFAPKVVAIYAYKYESTAILYATHATTASSGVRDWIVAMDGLATDYREGGFASYDSEYGGKSSLTRKTSDGKTVQWYNQGNAAGQFNGENYTYYYFAIG